MKLGLVKAELGEVGEVRARGRREEEVGVERETFCPRG